MISAHLAAARKTQPETRAQLVERMADRMNALAANGQTVDEDSLGIDFTSDEISAHWRAARDLARQTATRQVA